MKLLCMKLYETDSLIIAGAGTLKTFAEIIPRGSWFMAFWSWWLLML